MNTIKKNLPYILTSLVIFAAIALIYNAPVISGKMALTQPDIVNYKGSAQEMLSYQKETGENIYWSDAMFGGMPTYQTGAQYANDWIKKLDTTLRFLPRPADYLFLLFAGFFFLGLVLFKNWKYAFLGACFFAMGTYFFQLFEAGHNSKVHAIAYFAPLTAGILLLYRKKYVIGFLVTALFMALQLVANHPQMTYYLGLGLIIYVIIEGIQSFKKGEIKHFITASALAGVAVLLGIGMNASSLLATYEYSQASTRGKNDVTVFHDENHQGLNKDYITQWSYGKLETLNLLIPNFMGGGSVEPDTYKENLKASLSQAQSQEEYEYFSQALSYIPTYWGDQPFTSGPAYQGAIVVFLFLLGLFLVKGKYKWWLALATLLSIVLAWGKNLMPLTDFFIDFVPLYDKFRAVSSILVLAEFTMPLLAILAVYYFFNKENISFETKRKSLIYSTAGILGFLLILFLFGKSLFGFDTEFDKQLPQYMQDGIIADRVAMFKKDLIRSFIFIALAVGLLWAYLYQKIKIKEIVLAALAILAIMDLWGIDKRYLNESNFIPKSYVDYPFPTELSDRLYTEAQSNPALMQIAYKVPVNKVLATLKKNDPSHYRVYNAASNVFNDASTSYFVNSVGGYHGAKLQNYQNIIDLYLIRDSVLQSGFGTFNKEQKIMDLLNVKYFVADMENNPQAVNNPGALGNAWFVSQIIPAKDANEAVLGLAKIDLKKQAYTQNFSGNATQFQVDSTQNIQLKTYAPNRLVYQSQNKNPGFAVFSEIYYQKGWNATIDGKSAEIIPTNYFLRGLSVPAGNHEIVFTFQPEIVKNGNLITLGSNLIFLLLLIGGGYWLWKNKENNSTDNSFKPKKNL